MLKLAIVQSGHANVPAIYQLVALQPLALLYTLRHKKNFTLLRLRPPPAGGAGRIMFSCRPCVRASVRPACRFRDIYGMH